MKFTVKQARTYRGKTQIEMAQLLGVHHETYRKMEREPEKNFGENGCKILSAIRL